MPEEVHEDALSFVSVALLDSSSLDILSLLEGDNSDNNNTIPAKNPLDIEGEVDKMDWVCQHEHHSVQHVNVLSHGSEIAHPDAIDLDVANKTKSAEVTYSE